MNPFRSNVGTLNEILFENKNKRYGAYAIRVAYESTVLKSLAITASIMLGGAWFLSILLGAEPEITVPDSGLLPPPVVTYTIDLMDPNKPKDPPRAKQDPPKTAAGALANSNLYSIKDKPADTSNIKIKDPINEVGTNSVVGTNTTAITDPGPTSGTTNIGGGGNGNEPFNYYEEAPECPGGLRNFWGANLRYPNEARELGIEGKVYVNFVLDEEGKIMSCKIIKKLGYGCDDEVLRVVKLMPKWKPARIMGKPVKVTFNQVVDFKLK